MEKTCRAGNNFHLGEEIAINNIVPSFLRNLVHVFFSTSEPPPKTHTIPQLHVERMLQQPTPIPRFESQCNQHMVYEVQFLWAWGEIFKNLLMPLFLMGCFPVDFQEVKLPLRAKSGKRPIKGGKRPIKEGKRPHEGHGAGWHFSRLLNGLFSGTPAVAENGPSKKAH